MEIDGGLQEVSQVSGPTASYSDLEDGTEDDAEEKLSAEFVEGGSLVVEGAEGVQEALVEERATEGTMVFTGDIDQIQPELVASM